MAEDCLAGAEVLRVLTLTTMDASQQARFGQFFTPARAAALLADMPRMPDDDFPVRVLDPGAGSGMLMAAIVRRIVQAKPGATVHVTAVEVDPTVIPALRSTAALCVEWARERGATVSVDVRCEDLIYARTGLDAEREAAAFDLVIMNPPYAKLASKSAHREALAALGVDTPNLYAAFLALGVLSLCPGGQLVAITPRSFANGPYFERFRKFLLNTVAIDRLHTFESRSTVFSDAGVLQENVVFSATKGGDEGKVRLTSSEGHLDESTEYVVDYSDLVRPDDPHRFLRIAASETGTAGAEAILGMPCSLSDLGLSVSTGRVVDFRVKNNLRGAQEEDCVPLIYPGNLRRGQIEWPRSIRKPQAFAVLDGADRRALVPSGCYVLVKRFSAKEERRRIVAAVWDPEVNGRVEVAFENHLNVFHHAGAGLDREVAQGLSLWLNGSLVDRFFRTFSGHTQVNATDLRSLRFPPLAVLCRLARTSSSPLPEQADLDALIEQVLATGCAA